MRDGHGDVSMGAALRVIIVSGAGEGQEVPQGARTVDRDCAPIAANTRAARESFMMLVLVSILTGMFLE